jgi:transposase
MLDEGLSWSAIGERLPCTPDYIGRWKRRFAEERMAGLYARHRGRAPGRDAAKVEARVLAWTQKAPTVLRLLGVLSPATEHLVAVRVPLSRPA